VKPIINAGVGFTHKFTSKIQSLKNARADKDGNLVGIEIWKASQNVILPISKDIAEKLKLILENPA